MPSRLLPWFAVAAVAAACSAGFLSRGYSEWEGVYVPAAARLWAGEPLYRGHLSYLYPPLPAFLALPWVFLPPLAGRVASLAVNAVAAWAIFRLGWGLAGGSRRDNSPRDWTAWVAGIACGGVFLQNAWSHQQTDLALASLQLAGLTLLVRGRDLGAAALFGVAAALKCTPLLWVPYLVWRGRIVAAGVLVAVATAASLLPDLVSRPAAGTWIGEYAGNLTRHGSSTHLGVWGTDPLYNQSLAGASLRLLAVEARPHGKGIQGWFRPDWVSPVVQRRLVLAAMAVLVVVTLACAGRPGFVTGPPLAWEGAIVLVLALLLSPMSGPAHFGVLVLPGFLLARRAAEDRWCAASVAIAGLLALCNARDLIGPWLYGHALLCGCVTLAALTLLAGCWRELARLRWAAVPPEPRRSEVGGRGGRRAPRAAQPEAAREPELQPAA